MTAPAISPTPAEIDAHIKAVAKKHPDKVTIKKIGASAAGRPMLAAIVTDKKTSDVDKQNVVVTGGHHGDEESGRAIALALLDWLVTPQGKQTRKNQKISILPCANPDGAAIDSHYRPDGAMLSCEYEKGGPKSVEAVAVQKLLTGNKPEVFVDLHSRGYSGVSYDMVMFPVARTYTEDEGQLYKILTEMTDAGEAAGTPHVSHPLTWDGWHGPDINGRQLTKFPYREFKSIVLLTETAESNTHTLSLAHRAKVGLARLKPLLACGNRKHPKLYYSGYPFQLVVGSFYRGIVAVGKTASARRASRVGIWSNADHFEYVRLGQPEQAKFKQIGMKYSGKLISAGAGFQFCAHGRRKVKSVHLNGVKQRKSETNGYYTWKSGRATFVVVAVPKLTKRTHDVTVEFE